MTETPDTPRSSVSGGLRAESEQFLALATNRGTGNDVLAIALVGCGYALLALHDQGDQLVADTAGQVVDLHNRSGHQRHGPDVCGWDIDELADLIRAWEHRSELAGAVEDVREWFHDHKRDADQYGGAATPEQHDPDAAYEAARDRAAFEKYGPA